MEARVLLQRSQGSSQSAQATQYWASDILVTSRINFILNSLLFIVGGLKTVGFWSCGTRYHLINYCT